MLRHASQGNPNHRASDDPILRRQAPQSMITRILWVIESSPLIRQSGDAIPAASGHLAGLGWEYVQPRSTPRVAMPCVCGSMFDVRTMGSLQGKW